MMRATDFEFRNRWWLFGVILGAAFFMLAIDHVPVGSHLADHLAAAAFLTATTALHIVFGISAVIMIAAALVRMWGSAYLGREVVHDHALHSETLRADGPYRHVRNPLYLGNIIMAIALSVFVPWIGLPIILIGIPLFCYRLIGREEAALEAEQGEAYGAYLLAVPRLFPSLRSRIPASGAQPDWLNGLTAEAFFISFALGVIAFAVSINIHWLYAGFMASPLLSWLAGRATKSRNDHP
jgi:protein-S-isoprenylcysteine O-methyltransferase Ste14